MTDSSRFRDLLGRVPALLSNREADTETVEGDRRPTEDETTMSVSTDERDGGAEGIPSTGREDRNESEVGVEVDSTEGLETPVSSTVIEAMGDSALLGPDDPSVVEVLEDVQLFLAEEIATDGWFWNSWMTAFVDDRQLAEIIKREDGELFVMVEGERLADLAERVGLSASAMRVVRDVHAGYAEVNGLVDYTLAMSVLCIDVPEDTELTAAPEALSQSRSRQ